MKYLIRATYNNDTYEFIVHDQTWWVSLLYKTGGITLNRRHVFLKYALEDFLIWNPDIIGHEAVHVQQARRMGWKYLFTYLQQAIQAKFVKRNIPMEIEAYAHEHHITWNIIR